MLSDPQSDECEVVQLLLDEFTLPGSLSAGGLPPATPAANTRVPTAWALAQQRDPAGYSSIAPGARTS